MNNPVMLEVLSFLLNIVWFALFVAIFFNSIGRHNYDDEANRLIDTLKRFGLYIVGIIVIAFVFSYLQFPFNNLFLINGLLINVIFYDFYDQRSSKKISVWLYLTILTVIALIATEALSQYFAHSAVSALSKDYYSMSLIYFKSIGTNLNNSITFALKLGAVYLAIRKRGRV
jgi:hypothetical protein